MVVGFNHNMKYKGFMFHVQTEDSGLDNPHIITLLYYGGNILASKKTSYSDIAKVDNLEEVVGDLMKEQHVTMLKRLKSGEFDSLIEQRLGKPKEEPTPEVEASPEPQNQPEGKAVNLDEIILSYLVGED